MKPRYLLRLARVETNIDSKDDEGQGVLEGRLQGSRVLGASAATPGNRRSLREFKVKEVYKERTLRSSVMT